MVTVTRAIEISSSNSAVRADYLQTFRKKPITATVAGIAHGLVQGTESGFVIQRHGAVHSGQCFQVTQFETEIPDEDAEKIRYFGKTASTEMFRMLSGQVKVDMFLLDGRLQQEDLQMISALRHDRTVFLIDDFEGVVALGGDISVIAGDKDGRREAERSATDIVT